MRDVSKGETFFAMKGDADMRTVFAVASWFLNREAMSHKKLQKLCYYTQAWNYALKDVPFMDTEFEAWVHGPVSRQLYEKYGGSGFKDLTEDPTIPLVVFSPEESEHLESVWMTYGNHTGNSLEALTHSEPPWINARRGCEDDARCSNVIDPEDMKRYYRSIYLGDLDTEA